MHTYTKRKSPPEPSKSPSPSEQNRLVEQALKRYNCTLDEKLSERARLLGLEERTTVCSLVNSAVEEYIKRGSQSQPH